MKKVPVLSIFIFLLSSNLLLAQTWSWARTSFGLGSVYPKMSITDSNGNYIVSGWFSSDTLGFDTSVVLNAGGHEAFIVKYNTSGGLQWLKSFGGLQNDEGYGVTADDSGNIYMTGLFNGVNISFGSFTLSSNGIADIFILKIDPMGNIIWAKSFGGTNIDGGKDLKFDSDGNLYLTGAYLSSSIIFGNDTLHSLGVYDIFLLKINPTGDILWAKSAGGTDDDNTYGIEIDQSNNVYITGYVNSAVAYFGNIMITTAGNRDVFLAKYDSSGNAIWVQHAGGAGSESAYGIALDQFANIYITGYFYSSGISFGNYTFSNPNNDTTDAFVVKYDSTGNVLWATEIGSDVSVDNAYGIAVDQNNYLYVSGIFSGSSITIGSYTLGGLGGLFVAAFDPSGNVVWAQSHGGYAWGQTLKIDNSGNLLMAGGYIGVNIIFGNDTLVNSNQSTDDMFLAKLESPMTNLNHIEKEDQGTVYPNPFITDISFNLEHAKVAEILIYNNFGQLLLSKNISGNENVNLTSLRPGVYVVYVKSTDGFFVKKIVKT